MLDSLLAPESPEQFSAWFEEIPFTEATVPATSHYKVYYHIYSGNDRGIQYAVYLRDPPASGYYSVNPQVVVDQGYIALGKEADEAIDFTAPSGYKELCVVINAETHCGFGSVSTSFALDYVKKKEIQDQAEKKDITTEKECISGSPSVWSLVNPNLQAGAEEVISPQIAMEGIVRVCSTENPGKSVEGEKGTDSRWVDVGYCGNTNIKCWIDTDSVKKDLEQVNAIEGTTSDLLERSNQARVNGTLTEIASVEELSNLREEIGKIELSLDRDLKDHKTGLESYIEGQINTTVLRLRRLYGYGSDVGVGFLNADKAEAMALERDVYDIVIRALMELNMTEVKAAVKKSITDAKITDEVVSTTSASEEQGVQDEEPVVPVKENVELEVIESTDFSGVPTIGDGKAQGGIYIGGVDTGLYLSRLATVERGYQIINKRGLGIFEFVIKDYIVGNVFSNDYIAFYENEISSNEKIKNINNILKNYCFDTIKGEEFYPKLAGSCGGIEDEV